MAQLIFHVENQYIHRLDEFHVVARSNNYLYAEFTFSDDWVGEKTALFSVEADDGETITKPMLIGADGTCEVPHEVLEYDDSQLEVSAFCGNRVTANKAIVIVHASGYNDESAPDDPTPDVYTQILNRLANVEQIVVDKATEAESWAVGGTETREDEDIDNSKYYAEQAGISATAAASSATNALESAENASDSASSAHADAGIASQKSAETIEAKESVDSSLVEMRDIETNVGTLADNAAVSAEESSNAMSAARGYSEAAAANARTATVAAEDAASAASYVSGSVSRAAGYATNAQNYASAAERSMQGAATSERNAAQSSTNAATYASNAEESATNSALSASDSNGYAGAALQSENEAKAAQTAAESARDDAVEAKNVAETKAQDIQSSAQQIATNTQNIATNTADIAQNTSDIADVKDNLNELSTDLNELQDSKADIIISSAEGTVASFSDGAEYDAVSLIAYFEPYQEGTGDPSPDNIRPISGFTGMDVQKTGKNLWAFGSSYSPTGYQVIMNRVPFDLKAGTYTFSAVPNIECDSIVLFGYHADGTRTEIARLLASTTRRSVASTVSKDVVSLYFVSNKAGTISDIQLELGSTATAYEPYDGETYPIIFPTAAGIVYGGYVDVTRGKVVAEWGNIASYNGEALPGKWLSDRDIYAVGTTPTIGAQVVYELAAPIEYDITPTAIKLLKGYNNIWNSAGSNNEVEYRADTKLYIDGKQLDIRGTIAPVEDGDTASQAYAVGRYFYRNGAFCKSKAAIASGAAFTLNTNYEVTTVANELYTALH